MATLLVSLSCIGESLKGAALMVIGYTPVVILNIEYFWLYPEHRKIPTISGT